MLRSKTFTSDSTVVQFHCIWNDYAYTWIHVFGSHFQ